MKKRNMIAALLCSACLVAGSVNPVFADASKVVTLGADLTDAQKQTMRNHAVKKRIGKMGKLCS